MEKRNKELKSKLKNKALDENGYPIPRSEICCEHGERFWLTFSFSRKDYSLKNSLFYWSKREEYKEKWICSPCLKSICLDFDKRKQFLKILDSSKKGHLRSYLSRNII